MREVDRAWDSHNGRIFSPVRPIFVIGESAWGVTTCREFNDDDILMLEQRGSYTDEEIAPFIEIVCLRRMLKAHLMMRR